MNFKVGDKVVWNPEAISSKGTKNRLEDTNSSLYLKIDIHRVFTVIELPRIGDSEMRLSDGLYEATSAQWRWIKVDDMFKWIDIEQRKLP